MVNVTNISFGKPEFDGLFHEIQVILSPEVKESPILHLKHRQNFNESDLHIALPEALQKRRLAGEIITAAVEQLSTRFGLLVIAKARITNLFLFKVIDVLITKNELKIEYNTEYDRWEFSSRK